MNRKTLFLAISIGMICAIGPLATDMYLGAMPLMATSLSTTAATIQLSVMTFFSGFTIGQMFYGPISDRTGRKPIIYVALAIFCLSSFGCLTASTGEQLLVWRFMQGVGGSIGMVIGTAIIRDTHTGPAATKLMSMVMLVIGVAPILAPFAGSLILKIANWQMIFVLLGCYAALCFVVVALWLPETRLPADRASSKPSRALITYGGLLISRNFIPYAGTMALVQGGFFAYIAGSSFMLMTVYGLSAISYSIIFSTNAIGLGIGTQICNRFATRFGVKAAVRGSVLLYTVIALILVATQLTGTDSLTVTCILMFILVMSIGGIMPGCNVLAMEAHGSIAGTAAALAGGLSFGAGALSSFVLGLLENGTALPLVCVMAGCGILAVLVTQVFFEDRQETTVPEKA
ncbi:MULTISPECIES: multidrug effflux MFS transporter [Rhizobium/Agrobacterium group]|uniref:Bcr/CflA family efflux transporter n=2 Tax=Rhizobium/Agrobacterium group TaxID=227290 RepID=B9JRB5_ALLAM|nr:MULTISPECIES: multidrug effflux MFS transporter [Rhizobium/Agrobacterium group]ACM37526.1 MFS permease [Allorhizobium ampelinum S4]MBF2715156.1 multidrug effflux MFS transporter [Agrobacterium vitis]MCF1433686.1 multidrug effflux MFS transporter [Allorhizobium ampelinum]MCF1448455.1 multidrug effflux MFS transporter [Allorhizobium ampelinum]MCF1470675.1 multidrug effflux MFS transporter [Allorhizobium ampelinum]